MKFRRGFVSNSSSSSFIIDNHECEDFKIFKKAIEDGKGEWIDVGQKWEVVQDLDDNATWNLCYELGIDWEKFLYQTYFNG